MNALYRLVPYVLLAGLGIHGGAFLASVPAPSLQGMLDDVLEDGVPLLGLPAGVVSYDGARIDNVDGFTLRGDGVYATTLQLTAPLEVHDSARVEISDLTIDVRGPFVGLVLESVRMSRVDNVRFVLAAGSTAIRAWAPPGSEAIRNRFVDVLVEGDPQDPAAAGLVLVRQKKALVGFVDVYDAINALTLRACNQPRLVGCLASKDDPTSGGRGIVLDDCDRFTATALQVLIGYDDGLVLGGCDGGTLGTSLVRNTNATAVLVADCHMVTLTGVQAHCGRRGFDVRRSYDVALDGCQARDQRRHGIGIDGQSYGISVDGGSLVRASSSWGSKDSRKARGVKVSGVVKSGGAQQECP